jgi:hypothetical protein
VTRVTYDVDYCRMTVAVEMQNTGDQKVQRDVVAMVEHVLADQHLEDRLPDPQSKHSPQSAH